MGMTIIPPPGASKEVWDRWHRENTIISAIHCLVLCSAVIGVVALMIMITVKKYGLY